MATLVSVIFPGAGHGLAGRWRRGLAWAAAGLVTTLLLVTTVWMLPVVMLVRLAGAVDAGRCLRSAQGYDASLRAIAPLVVGVVTISLAQATIEAFKIPSSSMSPTLAIGDHVYIDKLTPRWKPIGRGEIVVHAYPCDRARMYIKRVVAIAGDTVELRCGALYVGGAAVKQERIGPTTYQDFDGYAGRAFAREAFAVRETLGDRVYETYRDRPEQPGVDAPSLRDFPARNRAALPSCSDTELFNERPAQGAAQPQGRYVETKAESSATPCEPQLHFVVPTGGVFVLGDNRDNANDSRVWGVVPDGDIIGRAYGVYWPLSRFGAVE